MKTNAKRKMMGIVGLGLVLGVYSFANTTKGGDDPLKKFEVIRIIDGESVRYDTLLPAGSAFTPTDYLTQLGFENDPTIEVINLCELAKFEDMELIQEQAEEIERNVVLITEDTEKMFGEQEEIEIRKEVHEFTTMMDEEIIKIEMDIDGINLDSLIMLNEIESFGDSMVFSTAKTMVIIELSEEGDTNGQTIHFKGLDAADADFHEVKTSENGSSELAVWNDGRDITIVIVSEVSPNKEKKGAKTKKQSNQQMNMQLYPNPSSDNVTLSADLDGKATTSLMITDIQGRVVMALELGQLSGRFSQAIDVKGWEKGVYLVQLRHGENTEVDRLIIE